MKPRLPNLVSLVSITSGGKPDSKAPCIIGGIPGNGRATQPYSWLDLKEHAANDLTQCSRSSLTLGDRAKYRSGGGEVLAKLIRPSARAEWAGLTTFAATTARAVQKDALNLWRSPGAMPFPARCISAGEAKSSSCSSAPSCGLIGSSTLWPPALALSSNGGLGSFGKFGRNPGPASGQQRRGALHEC